MRAVHSTVLSSPKYNKYSCNISSGERGSERGLLLMYGLLTQLEGNGAEEGTRDRLMAFFSERQ